MVYFVLLPKLPSAKETMEVVMHHVFLSKNILSNQGVQFMAQLWWEFYNMVGDSVSLSSSYHPQMNGQMQRLNQELEIGLRSVSE